MRRALYLCPLLLLGHCGPSGGRPDVPKKATAPEGADAGAPQARAPASAALVAELKADVQALAQKIGERNAKKHWELAAAADYIADELTKAGYEVGRQGYEVDDVVAQNLEVHVSGGERGDEVVIVGAHYDSAPGSPGADDNASGTAALLHLARSLRTQRLRRTLRFVFFANEEPPYFQTEKMGSVVYAKHAVARGDRIVAMVALESLGIYSQEPGSQRYPKGLREKYPTVGNFVAVVSDPPSAKLNAKFALLLEQGGPVPVVSDALPAELDGVGWSDQWSFWRVGVPALMVTDTAPFRYAGYHTAGDTPDKLDYETMAHAVTAIASSVTELANLPKLPPRE